MEFSTENKTLHVVGGRKKILTWDNLQVNGWEGPSICQLCQKDLETVNHLFINCTFTKQVWFRIRSGLNILKDWEGNTITGCYAKWLKEYPDHTTFPALISWNVWLERNKVIF